jgi:hypothetical protein
MAGAVAFSLLLHACKPSNAKSKTGKKNKYIVRFGMTAIRFCFLLFEQALIF